MGLSPDVAIAPTTDAPPDRPTMQLEEWARTGIALLFGDRKLDQNERRILRDFMEEVALRAQNGGVGNGGTPPAEAPPEQPPTPQEMNQNTEPYGTVPGTEPRQTDEAPY